MPTAEAKALLTLHRYYITVLTMRRTFYAWLKTHQKEMEDGTDSPAFPEYLAHVGMYYSTLFVAWDGWRQLASEFGYKNEQLTKWWDHPLRRKLGGYRDATMHYKRDYLDSKMVEFIRDPSSVDFVSAVYHELGDAILLELGRFEQ
jgi:hypothetical protein